jgi:probable addiction module antidote protein/putative addiction module killer protein
MTKCSLLTTIFELTQTAVFRKGRADLKDEQARALIASRLDGLAYGHTGDARPVGGGISELRIHHGPGYRVYSRGKATRSSFCFAAATRAPRRETSEPRNGSPMHGVTDMTEKLTTYDPAEDLTSDAAIATFMAEAFASEDAGYIAHALGVVARAKGMAQIASQTGLSREQLYRSFSENGNPTLKTTIAVMKALGIELTAKVHA